MDQARLNILESLFHEAMALAPPQRAAFADLACSGDEPLRQVLRAWLDEAQSVPAHAAAVVAAPLPIMAATTTNSLHDALTTAPPQAVVETDDIPPARPTHGSPVAPLPVRQLDQYRLLDLLGSGAMGRVYLAEDMQLGKRVALKILPGSFAQDAERVARFQREARMLALAQHPNIAEAYLLRAEANPPYLVMEYVPGETLGQRLQRGALPLHETLPLLRQIAAALQAAHARSVIHRDLKPDNIKLTPDGVLKLLDFGLAKQMSHELTTRADAQPRVAVFSTERNVVAGTVPYMSPEQTRGAELDARSDLWAFGCLAFEMLTGQRPFTGLTTHEVVQAIRTQEPPWSLLPIATPSDLRQLIQSALCKDKQQRLASATDATQALARISANVIKRARRRQWRKPVFVSLSLLASLLTVLSCLVYRQPLWHWLKAHTTRDKGSVELALPTPKRLLITPFKEKGAPPDFGKHLALALQARLRNVPGVQVMPYAEQLRLPARAAVTSESLRPLGVNLWLTGEIEARDDKLIVRYWLNDAAGQRLVTARAVETKADLASAQAALADNVLDVLKLQRPTITPNVAWQNAASEPAYLNACSVLQDDLAPEALRTVITSLEKLHKNEPQAVALLVTLAEAQLRLAQTTNDDGLFRSAQQHTEQALRLDGNDVNARLARGRLRLLLGDAAGAQTDLQQVVQLRPADIEALQQLGETHFELAHWDEAEAAFKAVTTAWPDYWRGYNDLGAFYFDRGLTDKALTNWQRVVALHPNGASGYVNVGNADVQMGKFAEAVAAYEQALRLTADGQTVALEAFIGLGAARYYAKAFDQSAQASERGLVAYPNNPTLYGNDGDALRYLTGKEAAALAAYTKAISLLERTQQPSDIQAKLAELYAKRSLVAARIAEAADAGTADQVVARRYLQRALRGDGANALSVQTRALLVAQLLGETDHALAHLGRAVALGFDPVALNAEPDLDKLRLDSRYELVIQQNKK